MLVMRPAIHPPRMTKLHSSGSLAGKISGPPHADERALCRARGVDLQAALADEEALVFANGPRQPRLLGIGQRVRVVADDQVPFFQAQQTLRLHPKGPRTGLNQRPPHVLSFPSRHVDLVSQFADKTHPHHQRLHPSHLAITDP